MSIRRMAAVWEISQHSGNALLLLLAIADFADDCGVAWPGHERLAEKTRVSRRHIFRLIDETSATGELWAMNRKRQQSNVYIVTPGLTEDELTRAIIRARDLGAVSTAGSNGLAPPRQVLQVVTPCHYLGDKTTTGSDMVSLDSDIAMSPGSDIAMSPDPSLSVITHQGTWNDILSELALQMTKGTFDQWLAGSQVIAADNGTWTVKVRNRYSIEWLDKRLRPVIERTMQRHIPGTELEFVA